MNRQEKAAVVEQIKGKADKAGIAIVTDFKSLTVEEMTGLRVKLREAGVDYQVVKNTLAKIAVTDGKHDVLKDQFKECCGLAFGYEDPVAAAKALADFAKGSKKFSIRFGSLDGTFIEADGVKSLAKLPSKPELLGMMLGTMNAVPTNLVGVLANVPRTFLYALNAIRDQKEAA